jgi:hypothetical protein
MTQNCGPLSSDLESHYVVPGSSTALWAEHAWHRPRTAHLIGLGAPRTHT